jgi:hypothetical protein
MSRALRIGLIVLLCSGASEMAHGGNREDAIAYMSWYTTQTWHVEPAQINNVFYDSRFVTNDPHCLRFSPLVNVLEDLGGLTATCQGAPYAYGARGDQSEVTSYLNNVTKPVGEDECQFDANGPFSGVTDCNAAATAASLGDIDDWNWRSWGTVNIYDNAWELVEDNFFFPVCQATYECVPGHETTYNVADSGDLLVARGEHVMMVLSTDGESQLRVLECTGNPAYERCIARDYPGGYTRAINDGYCPISVRGYFDNPATMFSGVTVEEVGSGAWKVRWLTDYLRDVWGFVIESSTDGESNWEERSDYILTEEQDSDEQTVFEWTGQISGWIRVIGIEVDTQEREVSQAHYLEQ